MDHPCETRVPFQGEGVSLPGCARAVVEEPERGVLGFEGEGKGLIERPLGMSPPLKRLEQMWRNIISRFERNFICYPPGYVYQS